MDDNLWTEFQPKDFENETPRSRKRPLTQSKLIDIRRQEWQKQKFPKPQNTPKRQRFDLEYQTSFVHPDYHLQFINEKLSNLEETTKKFSLKVKLQARDIQFLKERSTSMSSTSETSPWQQQGFTSPGLFTKSESPSSPIEQDIVGDPAHVLIYGYKVDRLKLQSAKLQCDPSKCGLQLLGCLFSPEELVNGNPSGITNSKDEMRQKSIKKLDPLRITYIHDYIEEKWPNSFPPLLKKFTQKCTDMYNNRKELRHS